MSQRPIPIFMYHSIASMPKGTIMRSLHVPKRLFSLQMRVLRLLGYRGLSMDELQPYLEGKKIGKVVGITFDDGFKNNLTSALPILKKFGFSATCYIISKKIGGINDWDLEKGIPVNPLMNKAEIHTWIEQGMSIGSHTQHHVHLAECDKVTAQLEITQSKMDLEKEFNIPVNHFCYPYGSMNDQVKILVQEAGYQSATTVNRGRAHANEDLLSLPRVPITHRTFLHLLLIKVLSRYEDKHA